VNPEALEGIEPINRDSVEERVADALRELIVSGQLPEGTPLVQREVAQRLGVSQTPVRIGLSELEREGLVEVGDTGRALVSRLTREDFEEIYAARLGLEGLAARVGVAALTDADVAAMRQLMGELDRLAKRQDVDAYLRARWDFHAICYLASGRVRLVAEVERLFWRAERYNRLVLSTAARFRRSVGYYREFLSACERRDADAAEQVIHTSIRGAVEMLSASLPPEHHLDAA
jgi:DNA-binding GntR family transcriptional regulator